MVESDPISLSPEKSPKSGTKVFKLDTRVDAVLKAAVIAWTLEQKTSASALMRDALVSYLFSED